MSFEEVFGKKARKYTEAPDQIDRNAVNNYRKRRVKTAYTKYSKNG